MSGASVRFSYITTCLGKMIIRFQVRMVPVFCEFFLNLYIALYLFLFGFEGGIKEPNILVSGHCLSFYFVMYWNYSRPSVARTGFEPENWFQSKVVPASQGRIVYV